ncbi:MAG: FecR family protein [Prevotellaceae bacterium]|nr:FecR family protein [Prevotellaceae bacterium]
MEEAKYNNIAQLLPRYYDGLTTAEESLLVEQWIKEDDTNRKMAEHIHALSLAADTLAAMRHTDTGKALKKVKRKMNKKEISLWVWAQRIAAVLFIPLFIAALLMYVNGYYRRDIARMIEVKTNPGMMTSIVLPDSTVVHLNSESTLRYPSQFGKKTRPVELSGEAYFEVAKDAKKRFVVTTPDKSRIEVYGTSFNVEAYEKDKKVSTTLVNGSVGFIYNDAAGKTHEIRLAPHQKLVYLPESKQARAYSTRQAGTDNARSLPESGEARAYATSCVQETAWKDGKIIFDNTPMEEILRMLGKRYNVEFVVTNPKLNEYAFTGSFTNQRLERIMEYFKISSRINWRYIDSADMADEKQKIEIY